MTYNATAIQQHEAGTLLNQHFRNTKENILGSGVKLCRRVKFPESVTPHLALISVKQQPNGRITADMWDVGHCGNAHLCAYCSYVKAAHIRDWIDAELLPAVKSHGLVLGLLTLTAHHRRDSDWHTFTNNFFKALSAFAIDAKRDFDAIGSLGRVRTFETPVGSNGLHGHMHDLFTYRPGTDIEALQATLLKKWKSALKKFDLRCSKIGIHILADGKFKPHYIAKEIAAHNTKKESKSDLVTLFDLLDKSARGDTQAGADWIRAAKAIQGRDRWNVGQLAKKLGISCPSSWKKKKKDTDNGTVADEPLHLISYPQTQHLMATEPNSKRPGLAMILRTARQSLENEIATQKIVDALCRDYTKQRLIAAPLIAATAELRILDNIQKLLTNGAISEDVADDLNTRAIAEIQLQNREHLAAINVRFSVVSTTQLHLQPGSELVFM